MAKPRRYAALDRLTPEQVRQFKHDAAAPEVRAQGLRGRARPVIVAHGDSWFDYPLGTDIVDCLRRFHGFSVRNHAQAGDTLENLIYGSRFSPMDRYRPLPSRLEDVIDDLRDSRARVLLFSGGGNDIAGEEFAQFLEHTGAGLEAFRRDHARHVIDVFFRRAIADMIRRATDASPGVHIFAHGYGYPVADGRGIGLSIGLSFIGPWLRPALAAKRIDPEREGRAIIRELIDLFNDMLASLDAEFDHFHHLDLRRLIGEGPRPWVNELHVRNSVYAHIADLCAARFREAAPAQPAARPRAASGRARGRPRPTRATDRRTRAKR